MQLEKSPALKQSSRPDLVGTQEYVRLLARCLQDGPHGGCECHWSLMCFSRCACCRASSAGLASGCSPRSTRGLLLTFDRDRQTCLPDQRVKHLRETKQQRPRNNLYRPYREKLNGEHYLRSNLFSDTFAGASGWVPCLGDFSS